MSEKRAYDKLTQHWQRIYRLEHLQAIGTWDRMTYMPAGSGKARAEGQAELAKIILEHQTAQEVDDWLDAAGGEKLGVDEAQNLSLMTRERMLANCVDNDRLERLSSARAQAYVAWQKAREAHDWSLFEPALDNLLVEVKSYAEARGAALGVGPYEAMLDEHDRGLTLAETSRLFDDVKAWLPGLVRNIPTCHAADALPRLDLDSQRTLCRNTMAMLGFDFDRGRLDESAHPFTGGTPEDVRITTRYSEGEWLPALKGLVHETGHALYQSHLPKNWRGQPLGEPCSAAMHEAQAIIHERQLMPSTGFQHWLQGALTPLLAPSAVPSIEALSAPYLQVQPGYIRVEADEATYGLHILIRFEIEKALFDGSLNVKDIPAAWHEKLSAYLDLPAPDDDNLGPLQDIHWSQGMFGYFPSYLYGAIIAAQLYQAFSSGHGDFDKSASRGDTSALREWLRDRVWSEGAAMSTAELVRSATAQPISGEAFRNHLEGRFGVIENA